MELSRQLEGSPALPTGDVQPTVGGWPLTQGASPLPRGPAEESGHGADLNVPGSLIDTQPQGPATGQRAPCPFPGMTQRNRPRMRLQDLRRPGRCRISRFAGHDRAAFALDLAAQGACSGRGAPTR